MEKELKALVAQEQQSHEYNSEIAMLDFGELVCRLMDDQGMTKSQIAQKAGLHAAQITRALSGDHNLTVKTIGKIMWALHKAFCITEIDVMGEGTKFKANIIDMGYLNPANAIGQESENDISFTAST